jgi:tRNA1Val (adenine37-N6)-methyltransferase
MPGPGETVDQVVYPDLSIIQKEKGYRFSLDPVLLADFLEDPPPGPLIDLGCGSGVMALLAARRWPHLHAVGLEIQKDLADMAGRSVVLNGLGNRMSIVRGDIRDCPGLFRPSSFGTAVSNPPYRRLGTGRLPPDRERALARHEVDMNLADLLRALEGLLRPGGIFSLTWKPERFEELGSGLEGHSLNLVAVRAVRARSGEEPFILLCRGVKGGDQGKVEHLPDLVIHEGNLYTEEAYQIISSISIQ